MKREAEVKKLAKQKAKQEAKQETNQRAKEKVEEEKRAKEIARKNIKQRTKAKSEEERKAKQFSKQCAMLSFKEEQGCYNGTRMIVNDVVNNKILRCTIINGSNAGEEISIPRIKL
jgi:hypothetical protein